MTEKEPRLSLAELVSLVPPETPVERDPAMEAFVRSEHYQPVLRVLRRAQKTMLRQQEKHLSSSSREVLWFAASHAGLKGLEAFFEKHRPKENPE